MLIAVVAATASDNGLTVVVVESPSQLTVRRVAEAKAEAASTVAIAIAHSSSVMTAVTEAAKILVTTALENPNV